MKEIITDRLILRNFNENDFVALLSILKDKKRIFIYHGYH